MQAIEMQLAELSGMHNTLEEFKTTQAGKDMLFQVTPGVFGKATLKESDELIVNVGAGVAVTKSIEESKTFLGRQVKEMQELQQQLMQEMRSMVMRAAQLEQHLGMLQS